MGFEKLCILCIKLTKGVTSLHPGIFTEGSVRLATGFGWLWFVLFHPLPSSAWADGKLAEVAEQVGKMGEYPKSKVNPTQSLTLRSMMQIYECYLPAGQRSSSTGSPRLGWQAKLWKNQMLSTYPQMVGEGLREVSYCCLSLLNNVRHSIFGLLVQYVAPQSRSAFHEAL